MDTCIWRSSTCQHARRSSCSRRLLRLMRGNDPPAELVWPPYRSVLLDIGNRHAAQLLSDETGHRLAYWPRVWAARSLAYVGNKGVGPSLLVALGDRHWRVRMTAIQTLGRLGIEDATTSWLPHSTIDMVG